MCVGFLYTVDVSIPSLSLFNKQSKSSSDSMVNFIEGFTEFKWSNKCFSLPFLTIKPSNHGNIAGVILTALFVMIYIIVMDTLAVIMITTNTHEYSDYDIHGSLNFYVVIIMFALDVFAMLYSYAAWTLFVGWTCSYKSCNCHIIKITSCLRNSLKCLFVPYLYLVFGYKKHDKFWKEEDYQTDGDNEVTENVFCCSPGVGPPKFIDCYLNILVHFISSYFSVQ